MMSQSVQAILSFMDMVLHVHRHGALRPDTVLHRHGASRPDTVLHVHRHGASRPQTRCFTSTDMVLHVHRHSASRPQARCFTSTDMVLHVHRHGALCPQKPQGLLGTGKEQMGQGMRAQAHLPVHTAELQVQVGWRRVLKTGMVLVALTATYINHSKSRLTALEAR